MLDRGCDEGGGSPTGVAGSGRDVVAYVMSRFPKLTETFVLYEILELERQGARVEVYPLLRERVPLMHPEAGAVVARAHYTPFLGWVLLRAQLRFLSRSPRAYLGALADLLRGTWGSRRYFVGALGLFPKAVAFADQMAGAGVTHVHAHFASHPAAAAFVIHRLTGIPYSFTAHGSDLHRERRMLREKVAEAAFVVAISEYNRDVIVDECGPDAAAKTVVIHCGVDGATFRAESRNGVGRDPDDTLRLVCTGTLHEVKGQAHLVEACRILRERGVSVACDLVGEGPDRVALEAQVRRHGLEGCVRLQGARTREEVAEFLRQAEIAVAPSVPTASGRREGIPVALMEALASGLPVVASDLSGIPELVEHEKVGLLVPPGDAVALADAIARLAGSPQLRARLGQEGRKRIQRDFDLATNVKELAARIGSARCS